MTVDCIPIVSAPASDSGAVRAWPNVGTGRGRGQDARMGPAAGPAGAAAARQHVAHGSPVRH